MTKLPVIADNQKPSVCAPCGGKCCKRRPGYPWPEDFGATPAEIESKLAERLRSGKWTIDWSDYSDTQFPRPAIKGYEGQLRHAAETDQDECTLLTPTGCSLRFEERPTMCRVLEPRSAGGCRVPEHYNNFAAIRAWEPYQDVVANAVRSVEGD